MAMSKDIITGEWRADGFEGKWKVRAAGKSYKGFYIYTNIKQSKNVAKGPLIFDVNGNGRFDASKDLQIGFLKADLDDLSRIPPAASGTFSVNLDTDRLRLLYDGSRIGGGEIFAADRFFG